MQKSSGRQHEKYSLKKELGRGAFSKVFLANESSSSEPVAVKVVRLTNGDSKSIQNTLNEIRILFSVNHPNVIGYKEAFARGERELWVVMECAGGGDLSQKILQTKNNNSRLPENIIWSYVIQLLQGLSTLHEMNIIHRDIKPANLLLDSSGEVLKIGDLNVAKVANEEFAQTQVGTPLYLAPEVWAHKPYSSKADIFSLGCVAYEMAALAPPFEAPSIPQLYSKVSKEPAPSLPSHVSPSLALIIFSCLEKDPEKRPSAVELLSHPAVRQRVITSELKKHSELLSTIVAPQNLSELNSVLPSKNSEKHIEIPKEKPAGKVIDKQIEKKIDISQVKKVDKIPDKPEEKPKTPPTHKRNQSAVLIRVRSGSVLSSGVKPQVAKIEEPKPEVPKSIEVFRTPLKSTTNLLKSGKKLPPVSGSKQSTSKLPQPPKVQQLLASCVDKSANTPSKPFRISQILPHSRIQSAHK